MHIYLNAVFAIIEVPHKGVEFLKGKALNGCAVVGDKVFAEEFVQTDIVVPVGIRADLILVLGKQSLLYAFELVGRGSILQ